MKTAYSTNQPVDVDDNVFQKNPQPYDVVKTLKDRVIVGNLHINSIPNKYDALKTIIPGNIDVFVITETKRGASFETAQFLIEGV